MNPLIRLLLAFQKRNFVSSKFRNFLLRLSRIVIDKSVCVSSEVDFRTNYISIGPGSLINKGSKLYSSNPKKKNGRIIIGKNVYVACDVSIVTSTHLIGPAEKRCGEAIDKDVVIKDGCWIGTRVTILPGVTIGEGCVIGAGSIVTKDCEPNHVYYGVPAKKQRKI